VNLTLALESSAKAASVALCDGGTLIAQSFQNAGLTHSQTLLKMTEDMLRSCGVKLADVARIAVAAGPGSFTGIRIGVAAAKGLAWGSGKPLRGVSTLRATVSATELPGVLCPVMDARRGEVYNAVFRYDDGLYLRECDDRAVSLEVLADEARNRAVPYVLLGDGAELAYEVFRANHLNAVLAPELLRLQCAYGVAVASLGAADATELEPMYLRLSQAERELTERGL
jgi:tRNA threonylcarbamoyladenosine biosynthesis protein TsaB